MQRKEKDAPHSSPPPCFGGRSKQVDLVEELREEEVTVQEKGGCVGPGLFRAAHVTPGPALHRPM